MAYNTDQYHRRSLRLPGYDYTRGGAYFVTVCTHHRACLFGEIVDDEMRLNKYGAVVHQGWERTGHIRENVEIDMFVVMANHIHGIIVIPGRGTLPRAPTAERFGKPTSNSVPTIIRLFKSTTTKRINEMRSTPGVPVWQRNYYEHIIRDDKSLNQIREYIVNNPLQWAMDRENPDAAIRTIGARGHVPLPKGESWRV